MWTLTLFPCQFWTYIPGESANPQRSVKMEERSEEREVRSEDREERKIRHDSNRAAATYLMILERVIW